jgi:heterodisulfide reductase subunit A-like polyferredoxin
LRSNNSLPILNISSGIARMQAANSLGDMGIKIHLIEKKSSIGGRIAQLDGFCITKYPILIISSGWRKYR